MAGAGFEPARICLHVTYETAESHRNGHILFVSVSPSTPTSQKLPSLRLSRLLCVSFRDGLSLVTPSCGVPSLTVALRRTISGLPDVPY
jgi:hypothetical protein